ncbi:hypothetical protein L1987_48761 [Smallanthus sonchifolius]|uniref:Uncharacterized protein n=1 Tax=Smallanthus sonchifolius TaxID=185202 RepID=A0ACB9FTS0_9ASTR|nr:hypothetical protein L1987_48761 [Smallanthus sonchifolius]
MSAGGSKDPIRCRQMNGGTIRNDLWTWGVSSYIFCARAVPFVASSSEVVELTYSWKLWNSFRELCEHHSQLSVALDVRSSLQVHTNVTEETGRKLKVYAVEKNPNGVVTLHERIEAAKLFASKEVEEEAKEEPVKTFVLR